MSRNKNKSKKMKKLFLMATMLLTFSLANAQNIADVQRNSSGYCKVYDANNKQISSGYVGNSSEDFSYSNCIIVVRNSSGYVKVYDENLKQISSGYCGNSDDSFNVVGCNIIVKNKSNYKKTYDKNLKQISSGY